MVSDSDARKAVPLATGLLDYFPDALAEVARLSKIGNDKHNPGQALHWSREKSADHADCIMRHMLDRGTVDDDGVLHDAKVAWRALAQLQLALEMRRKIDDVTPKPAADAHPTAYAQAKQNNAQAALHARTPRPWREYFTGIMQEYFGEHVDLLTRAPYQKDFAILRGVRAEDVPQIINVSAWRPAS